MSDCLQIVRLDSICLGWALIHFLWQGLVIAFVLEFALGLTGRKNASLRYLLCGVALAAMPLALTTTYWALERDASALPAPPLLAQHAVGGTTSSSSPATPVGFTLRQVARTITDFTSRGAPSFEPNRYMPGIVAGWLIGVVLLAGRKAGGFFVLWRLRHRGVSAPNDSMVELFRQTCGKIGVDSRRVCLKTSSLVQVPMTMGWIRPVVLFPAALLSGLSTGEIELLLAHELAHIRRCDYLVNLLQTVVETLFFYHPVTWWISRRMRQERENLCDDLVVSRLTEALAYAKILVRLETLRPPGAFLATAANGGSLLQRVERLIGCPTSNPGFGVPSLLVLFFILGLIATAVTSAEAQIPATGKSADIPVAVPVPARPEAVFDQPVTLKETKSGDNHITRLYYQGGSLILQQELVVSSGSIGQLVFYKGTVVVDDRRGTQPMASSTRSIEPNNFKIRVQSIAADSVSPEALRILDSDQQIITEFFIDKNGVMRPITRAEYEADLARRKAAFAAAPPANGSAASTSSSDKPDAMVITRASYEAKDGAGAKDVTDTVTKMINDKRLDVLVGNDVFGGDPAWLHFKQLRVDYTLDGKKQEAIADEGTTLSIPGQTNAQAPVPGTAAQAALSPAGSFGQLFGQLGKIMQTQVNAMAGAGTSLTSSAQKNASILAQSAAAQAASTAPTPDDKDAGDKEDGDAFALPPAGSFGQLGRVMEIHATFSRQILPDVAAVHYYSQYRGLGRGAEAGVSWGGEIAVYGLPSSFVEGSSWKGIVYPAGHMTFGWDRLSVYATTKETAIALMEKESEQDRKSFPP